MFFIETRRTMIDTETKSAGLTYHAEISSLLWMTRQKAAEGLVRGLMRPSQGD